MPSGGERDRPLAGVTVLVLRAPHQAGALADRLAEQGALVEHAPVLEIDRGNVAGLRRAVRGMAQREHQAICFTSTNAVDAVADALVAEGLDARAFFDVFVGCVGPATAERLERRLRIRPDLVPDTSTSESLAEVFPAGPGTVLLPRGDLAGPELPTALVAKGWDVDEVLAYRTKTASRLPREVLAALADGTIDFVTFTSASTAQGFQRLLAGRPFHAEAISIGPMTTAACLDVGIEVAGEARTHDIDGLVAAIVARARPDEQPLPRRRSGAPWPSERSIDGVLQRDAARAGQPVPVRHAVSFALGVGVLGAVVNALKPWEADGD